MCILIVNFILFVVYWISIDPEFKSLCGDFFKNRDYITANMDEMYMENGIWHCILVKCAASEIGILIESEGYDYARYTAVINISEVENG